MCWKIDYIVLIIASTLIDYFVAQKMATIETKIKRKKWLLISIITNLSILLDLSILTFLMRMYKLYLIA